jgi:hypothetical protein
VQPGPVSILRRERGESMSAGRSRIASRTTTLLVLIAAHGLILWTVWRIEVPVPEEIETFTSTMIWVPESDRGQKPTAKPVASRITARRAANPPLSLVPEPPAESSAITTPPAPHADIDWSGELSDAAISTLNKERHEADLLGALTRKYRLPDDPRDPHPDPVTGFRWYEAGSHRIDTRGSLPVLHLNDHCALVLFILPVCLIGHIEIHCDLFENAAALHDEKTSTARPNAVP